MPASWTTSGSTAATIAASCVGRRVGGDRDDEPAVDRRPPAARAIRARSAASSSASSRGVPGDDVEPDRVGAGGDRGKDALDVGDAADLDERPARDVGRIVRRGPGRHERARGCGRIRGPDERLADERAIEPERAPARDGRRLADARLGDDQPVVRDELAQSRRALDVHVERPQVAVVEPDEPRPGRERGVELPRVVGLDQRLEADLERALDEAARDASRGWSTASSSTRSAPAARSIGSWMSSTTKSLARTGTATAARTARRSSTEPPNQCGSHRTEMAAAPPAS